MGQIQSDLQGSSMMARLLLAGLLGLALVLLTVADEDGQVDVQDKANSGYDSNALERHRRNADPGKKSITGVKKTKEKVTRTRNRRRAVKQRREVERIGKETKKEMAKKRRKQRRLVGRTRRESRGKKIKSLKKAKRSERTRKIKRKVKLEKESRRGRESR